MLGHFTDVVIEMSFNRTKLSIGRVICREVASMSVATVLAVRIVMRIIRVRSRVSA